MRLWLLEGLCSLIPVPALFVQYNKGAIPQARTVFELERKDVFLFMSLLNWLHPPSLL